MSLTTRLNFCLKVTHLVVALILPTGSLVIFGLMNGLFPVQTTAWGQPLGLLWFVMPLPIFIVYAGIVFLNFFPKKNSEALQLFIPTLFGIGLIIWRWAGVEDLQVNLILEAIPMYLGIYFCLMCGLIYLAWRQRAQPRSGIKKLIVLCLVILPIILTAIPITQFGYKVGGVWVWTQTLVCVIFYFPKLIKLYLQKKL